MTELSTLIAGAGSALLHVLQLAPDDRVLVVTDQATKRIGEAFQAAAAWQGCATRLFLLPEAARPLRDIPPELAALLDDATVVVNAIEGRGEETPFRVAWLHRIEGLRRIRCGHSPGITEGMFEGGPLAVDYAQLRRTATRLVDDLAGALSARITAPGGTDLTVGLFGRDFRHDCGASVELMVNLPCGEAYCAPVETDADGLLVVDGAVSSLGPPPSPLRVHLRGGRIVRMSCEHAATLHEVGRLTGVDEQASVIGELGIGINPGARIVGRMLEDEKAVRTAHIAFGNNEDMPGGRNCSRTHNDFLIHQPTITVTYNDGRVATPVDGGVPRAGTVAAPPPFD